MDKNYQVEKSFAEVYTIRFKENRSWWMQAIVIENRGHLSIASSHGDFQYTWSSPGKPFKEFLTEIDDSYLKCKFGRMTYFDYDKTNRQLLIKVIEARRTHTISKEQAREFHDFIIDKIDGSSLISYQISLQNCPELIDGVFDSGLTDIPCVMNYESCLNSFVESLWPTFVKVLKEEIGRE